MQSLELPGASERSGALRLTGALTRVGGLPSWHACALRRIYHKEGAHKAPVGVRKAKEPQRNAVGFTVTSYRRLASSYQALASTHRRRPRVAENLVALEASQWNNNLSDDEVGDAIFDASEDVPEALDQALRLKEMGDIRRLLQMAEHLPNGSRLGELQQIVTELRGERDGASQFIVFTQYAVTIYFLREDLQKDESLRPMCRTERGGDVPDTAELCRTISRNQAKRSFREGEADTLLCTQAGAGALNSRFCGALLNYDMQLNSERVKQRLGRIHQLGQECPAIRILNLDFRDTTRVDTIQALGEPIARPWGVVGQRQPILARVSAIIAQTVVEGRAISAERRAALPQDVSRHATDLGPEVDIEEVADTTLVLLDHPKSFLTTHDRERVVRQFGFFSDAFLAPPAGSSRYSLTQTTRHSAIRIRANADYRENYAGSLVLWSPRGGGVPADWGSVAEHQRWPRGTAALLRSSYSQPFRGLTRTRTAKLLVEPNPSSATGDEPWPMPSNSRRC